MLASTYAQLPETFYERIRPEPFPDPKLVLFNDELAAELGLDLLDMAAEDRALVLAGQKLLPGSVPIAQAYAGAQFGHFVPQLGDGRAHLLGERNGYDIQLKGSGRTRFSRRGDGRSTLGAVIRECLVSEGMHALGVPTTRALGAVTTGETVWRGEGDEPGGILARVAASHIRVGTFQYFASRGDTAALEQLTDYTIARHYPDIPSASQTGSVDGGNLAERCLELIRQFAQRQGELVAKWYGFGFIHGVMNTDNCSLAGITIDYGPCAFMDEFSWHKVFSSIDQHGRYAYGNQMTIAAWNVRQFADCLQPLIAGDEKVAQAKIDEALKEPFDGYGVALEQAFGKKLGLKEREDGDLELIQGLLRYLDEHGLDFTLSFAHLYELLAGDSARFPKDKALSRFCAAWQARQPDNALMAKHNPRLIPRNHQVQRAITAAGAGDYEPCRRMWTAFRQPYSVDPEHRDLLIAPSPEERVKRTFCGT